MMANIEVISHSATTVAENLALDEQWARKCAATGQRVLRFWWGGPTIAVLGCADKPEVALDLDACNRLGIEHIKRVTGGGTVLQTPDVFNYSYTAPNAGLMDMVRVFEFGTQLIIRGLGELGIKAKHCGISDVAVGYRKISGNAQARKWRSILLHGTVLVDIDHDLMEAVLLHPAKEPDYRQGRSHNEFITTLRELGVNSTNSQIEDAFRAASKNMENRIPTS